MGFELGIAFIFLDAAGFGFSDCLGIFGFSEDCFAGLAKDKAQCRSLVWSLPSLLLLYSSRSFRLQRFEPLRFVELEDEEEEEAMFLDFSSASPASSSSNLECSSSTHWAELLSGDSDLVLRR